MPETIEVATIGGTLGFIASYLADGGDVDVAIDMLGLLALSTVADLPFVIGD